MLGFVVAANRSLGSCRTTGQRCRRRVGGGCLLIRVAGGSLIRVAGGSLAAAVGDRQPGGREGDLRGGHTAGGG